MQGGGLANYRHEEIILPLSMSWRLREICCADARITGDRRGSAG